MEYRRVGSSGLKVSVVGLGCNNFGRRLDESSTARVVHRALECGINFFDTADVYGDGESERFLGSALRGRQEEALIATKFTGRMGQGANDEGGSRYWIRKAVEGSLKRLDRDTIDLYQMHSPDEGTPLEETLSALDDLIHEGKVRYIGCSNFYGWQVADASWLAKVNHWQPFVSVQNHYSLLHREVEREVIPAAAKFGLGMLPYFPLASGMLTGKYERGKQAPEGTRLAGSPRSNRFMNDENFDIVEALERFAREHSLNLLQVAIGGLAAQHQVASVIAGATKPEQVDANVEAGSWIPTPEEVEEINRLAPSQHPAT